MKSILKRKHEVSPIAITRYEVLHVMLTIVIVSLCTLNIWLTDEWDNLTRFRASFIVPIILIGNVSKIILCQYFIKNRGIFNGSLIARNESPNLQMPPAQRQSQTVRSFGLVGEETALSIYATSDDWSDETIKNTVHNSYQGDVGIDWKPCAVPYRAKKQSSESITAIFVQIFFIILYFFICVMLGAPVFDLYEQTLLLSIILTTLTITPNVMTAGWVGTIDFLFNTDIDKLERNAANGMEWIAMNLFKLDAIGSLVGAWCGTIVVPLDWDCEWQRYPIPNIIGALIGLSFINILSGVYYIIFINYSYASKKYN